jgi:3-oxoacyl-[acyl-carrier protein] reductase
MNIAERNRSMNKLVAVVTGGTRGIGLGIASSLIKRGARVAVTYRENDEAAKAAEQRLKADRKDKDEINPLIVKGDVGNPERVREQYQAVRQALGPINVLVNNAGIMPARSFDEITVEEWNDTIRINLSGGFYWMRLALRDMKDQGFGRIVNISSIAAHGGGVIGPHYAASKAGMLGMTRYAANELGPYGITINAIAPAFIEDAGVFTAWSEARKEALSEKVMVPRIGNVQDVVRAFNYLMDSPFVTGVTLDVNGGAYMM